MSPGIWLRKYKKKIIKIIFNDLLFVNMFILFLFKKKFIKKIKNIRQGRIALKDNKNL